MRVAIVGSRSWTDYAAVLAVVRTFPAGTVIVSGGAKGADSCAEAAAQACSLAAVVHFPDWAKHGKRAGFVRNAEIVDDCDRVVAFWDGASRGTKHTIDLARKAGKLVDIHSPKGQP